VGLEHELKTIQNPDVLLKNSIASASLTAEILYQKFFMSLPLYRQELVFENFGLVLSRQTMCNWVIRFSFDLFGPIYDYLVYSKVPNININNSSHKAVRPTPLCGFLYRLITK